MNPNVTNTVPATQEEGALRIVPEQQQSSPDVQRRDHGKIAPQGALRHNEVRNKTDASERKPERSMAQQDVAEREKCHRHSETFDHEKPVQLRYGDIELVDDAVEHRTGKQALAAVGIES